MTGFFVSGNKREWNEILVRHIGHPFLFYLLDNAGKKEMIENEIQDEVKHPAEFDLRW